MEASLVQIHAVSTNISSVCIQGICMYAGMFCPDPISTFMLQVHAWCPPGSCAQRVQFITYMESDVGLAAPLVVPGLVV